MGIRGKLMGGAAVALLCISIVGGIGVFYTKKVADISMSVVDYEVAALIKLKNLEESLWEMWFGLVQHSGISDVILMEKVEEHLGGLEKDIEQQLNELESEKERDKTTAEQTAGHSDAHQEEHGPLRKNWGKFKLLVAEVVALSKDYAKEDALATIMGSGRGTYDELLRALKRIVKQHNDDMLAMRNKAKRDRDRAGKIIVLFTAGIAVLLLFLLYRLRQGLLLPINMISTHLKTLARGILPEEQILYTEKDEIKEIIVSTEQLKQAMESTISQANAIAAGNYEKTVILLSDDDQLGGALVNMTNTLREVSAKNREAMQQVEDTMKRLEEENRQRNREDWIKSGQNELNQCMSGGLDVQTLAEKVVEFITTYIEAQAGAFYYFQNERLKLLAGHHFNHRRTLANEFQVGRGLVGQAALEKQHILIDGIHDDDETYAEFISTEQTPRSVIALPFIYEGDLKGVLEMDFKSAVSKEKLEFLKQAMPPLAVAVGVAESRAQMQSLLLKQA